MANSPAAESEINSKLSLDGIEPGTDQYRHTKRLIKEQEFIKANTGVEDQWIEHHIDTSHPKGGKVILKKKMKDVRDKKGKLLRSGATYSFYLGRFKKGGKDAIQAYKLKGVEVRQPRMAY